MSIRVYCLLIDRQKNVIGYPFAVDVPSDALVQDLRKKIKQENEDVLANISALSLCMWKLRDAPIASSLNLTKNLNAFREDIGQHLSHEESDTTKIEHARLLYNLDVISKLGDWPAEVLHIIVQSSGAYAGD